VNYFSDDASSGTEAEAALAGRLRNFADAQSALR